MSDVPVDLTNFRELTGGDRDLEKELFSEFISSSAQLLDELQKNCFADSDKEVWRKSAHALKGIAVNLGAVRLGDLAKTAQENAMQDGDKTPQFEAIRVECERVYAFLRTLS